jgi:hypothetical protein
LPVQQATKLSSLSTSRRKTDWSDNSISCA